MSSALLAILALATVLVAEAAVRGGKSSHKLVDAQQGALVHGTEHEHKQGSKVGMHHEELLFARQKWGKRKFSHKMVNHMEIIHKTAYWGNIKLGTPAQDFKVIFDTGSGNLILPAATCNMAGCNSHKKYTPSDSSTSAAVVNERGERSTEISFGTGDISGDYYKDKFCIADNICTDVRFVAATAQSEEPFSVTPFDGILGLGFQDLSMGEHFNIIDDLNTNGLMSTFAVYLTDDMNSEITFGGYKEEQIASDIVWAPVVHESYWQVAVDDITFNNAPTGLCGGRCQVAVDTGTSMLAGPSDLVEKLSDKLAAKDDCSNFNHLPSIGFKIKNKVLNLSPEDYMDKSAGECSFSVMSLDVPPPKGPLFIFGDPFLRRFVTIYDREGPRVGFAVAKHQNLDSASASKIISDLDGSDKSKPQKGEQVAKVAKVTGPAPVAISLEGGMMTRDPSAADSTKDAVASTDHASDAAKNNKGDLSPMGDDFANAVDNFLKDSSTPSELSKRLAGNALVQEESHGLRGRRGPQKQKLVSVRLHRSH